MDLKLLLKPRKRNRTELFWRRENSGNDKSDFEMNPYKYLKKTLSRVLYKYENELHTDKNT